MTWRLTTFGAVLSVAILALIFLAPISTSQNAPTESAAQSSHSIHVDVDLVIVNVTVTDSRNRFVQGLSKEHFQVWEDKVEQEITMFEMEDAPVSLGIIVDRSGSMGDRKPRPSAPGQSSPSASQTLLDEARSSAYSCLRDGLRDDEYFLIEFSDSTQVVSDFTDSLGTLKDKLLFLGAGGSTSLWDAIYAGVRKLQNATHARKALLVLTDGEENSSRYSLSNVKEALRERDVRIYSMNLEEVQIDGMQQLVKLSGGMIFRGTSPCKELSAELRNQYVIGYRSTNRATDGAWRDIRVRMNTSNLPKEMSDLSVRARSGYFANH